MSSATEQKTSRNSMPALGELFKSEDPGDMDFQNYYKTTWSKSKIEPTTNVSIYRHGDELRIVVAHENVEWRNFNYFNDSRMLRICADYYQPEQNTMKQFERLIQLPYQVIPATAQVQKLRNKVLFSFRLANSRDLLLETNAQIQFYRGRSIHSGKDAAKPLTVELEGFI